jgi:hypothetical protein
MDSHCGSRATICTPWSPYEPCVPTAGTKVPDRPDWLHEIKHDGYRLIVQREDKRVRLFTRSGHDRTGRFPRIIEAALRNRSSSFVIDGEAVLLGVDGVSEIRAAFTPPRREVASNDLIKINLLKSRSHRKTQGRAPNLCYLMGPPPPDLIFVALGFGARRANHGPYFSGSIECGALLYGPRSVCANLQTGRRTYS